jgi:hypothetical protein
VALVIMVRARLLVLKVAGRVVVVCVCVYVCVCVCAVGIRRESSCVRSPTRLFSLRLAPHIYNI